MGRIVKLDPFISEKIWGGENLKQLKGLDFEGRIGETWEVSTLAGGESSFKGQSLGEFCDLSYLVKFIDTKGNLSIQVHPDDDYAKTHENGRGKSECWLILAAQEKSGIYLGLKKGVTKKEFFNAAENGLAIDSYLNFIPVKRGDFFFLPPGAIHAIGEGITLCEVQQSCGLTYRIWDWNRLGLDGKPRDLHLAKAKDITDFSDKFNEDLLKRSKQGLLESIGMTTLAQHEDFKVQLFSKVSQKKMQIHLKATDAIILLEGKIKGDLNLRSFESAIATEEGVFDFVMAKETSFLQVSGSEGQL